LKQYYLWTYGRPFAAAAPFAIACWAIERFLAPASLVVFFAVIAVASIAYVIPCWLLALTAAERDRMVDIVRRRIPRNTEPLVTPKPIASIQGPE
jgi:hypothetical protein